MLNTDSSSNKGTWKEAGNDYLNHYFEGLLWNLNLDGQFVLTNQHLLNAWFVKPWTNSFFCQKLSMLCLNVSTGENEMVHLDKLEELGGASLKDKAVF